MIPARRPDGNAGRGEMGDAQALMAPKDKSARSVACWRQFPYYHGLHAALAALEERLFQVQRLGSDRYGASSWIIDKEGYSREERF
jgi:hypothetical protein